MNSVLISGGSGFVGANLARRFIALGYKTIVAVENNDDLWRLSDVMFSIDIVRVNFLDYKAVKNVFEVYQPKIVFNTVSYGGLLYERVVASSCRNTPYGPTLNRRIYQVNVEGPINLLKAAVETGFDAFITLGSSEEYGLTEGLLTEESPLKPLNDYGVSKAMMTHFALRYAYAKDLPVYCVRPFAVYGDLAPKDKLIATLFWGGYKQLPVGLRSPDNVRDFIYIDDLVDLLILVCNKRPQKCFLFNAGTGKGYKVSEVVSKVEAIVGSNISVNWDESLAVERSPRVRVADSSSAEKILSWKPKYDLDKGLLATKRWFENNFELYEEKRCSEVCTPVS